MKKRSKVSNLALAAIMADLAIVLDMISIRGEFTKYTIYALPLILTGMLFGPYIGALSGAIAGFIVQLLTYGITPTTPLWIIAPVAWGFLSGVLALAFKKDYKWQKVAIIVFATSLIVTGINSLALVLDGLIMDYPTTYVLTGLFLRVVTSLGIGIFYTVTTYYIINRLKKYKFF